MRSSPTPPQASLLWRLRAPITLLTLVAFCASLLMPLTAKAEGRVKWGEGHPHDFARSAPQGVGVTPGAARLEPPSEPPSAPTVAQSSNLGRAAEHLDPSAATLDADRLQRAVEGAVEAAGSDPADDASTLEPTALPSGDDKSGVTSKSISVPEGSGTVQGMGESFSAQLSTGIMTYSVPFVLPTARGEVEPKLGLSYSSAGGHGNAGVGWSVGAAFIARQTDRGVPSYDDRASWHPNQDRFVFNGGQELVPICDVGPQLGCAGALPDEVMPSWAAGWQLHRARVEGSFMRFFWSPDRKSWRVQSKSGHVLELGVPLDGSGYTGALEQNPARPSEVYRWYLSREYDTQTDTGLEGGAPVNTALYRYQLDGESRYLTDIYDTTPVSAPTTTELAGYAHHTRLTWAPRGDVTHSYRSGWRMEQALRLARVDVTSARYASEGRELVRRYQLEYDPAYHVSLLKSVQLKGRCRAVAGVSRAVFETAWGALPEPLGCITEDLPKLRFGYSHVGPPTSDGFEPFDTEVRAIQGSPPHSLDEALSDLFDVNSDGLPDLVVTAPGLYGGGFGWFESGAGGELDTFSQVQTLAVRGALGANATTLQLTNTNLVALDLDGDGAANLLHMPVSRSYALYDFVRLPGGAYELQGRAVETASGLDVKIDFGRDAHETQLMDVDSDGLVDVVVTTGTAVQTFFNLGRLPGGDGQFGTGAHASATAANLSREPALGCVPHSGLPLRFSDAETTVADMNGDGLPDLVRVRSGDVRYWPGRGNGFFGTGARDDCPGGTFGTSRHVEMSGAPHYFGDALRLDDVNGDGLPDLVNIRASEVDIWLNKGGHVFSTRKIITGTPPLPAYQRRVRVVDVDGSGTRDLLWGNAGNYRYIDLQGGTRPWVLTQVDSSLGKTTTLEYTSSIDEMLAATRAGAPWSSRAPMALHVVKRVTETDNLNLYGRGERRVVTEYSYRDPVYDGRQREFRGFREVVSRQLGDANSPTSLSRAVFLLGECVYPGGGDCPTSDQSYDNPHEALKGLPVLGETYDERGVYLSTSHTHYTLRQLYQGLDGRRVAQVFPGETTEWRYDTAQPGSFGSKAELQLETVTASGAGVGPSLDFRVTLQAVSGAARLETAQEVDVFGNPLLSVSYGCVSGCPSGQADDVIEQHTEALLLPHGSGWLWRPGRSYTLSAAHPTPRGDTTPSYSALGDLTRVEAALSGTEPLLRAHASGGQVAPPPSDAAADTASLMMSEVEYDRFGSAIRSYGPGGRCADVFLDPLYGQLASVEMMYPGGCPMVRSLTEPPLGTLYSAGGYDRGLELVTQVVDVTGQRTELSYDGLGRLSHLHRSEPGSGELSALPSLTVTYDLATPSRPYSIVHTRSQDGEFTTHDAYRSTYSLVDGLGQALAELSEADPAAGDGGSWLVGEQHDFDAKRAVSRKCLPRFWNGTPQAFPLAAPLVSPCGRVEYDAFGRSRRLIDLDGTVTLETAHHALSSDAWDAADLEPGGAHEGTYLTEVSDGHGRAALTLERFKEGAELVVRQTRSTYLPTGELLTVTRSSSAGATTRWLRYDSLGRMVLNVEPHTTEAFTPDPTADATGLRTWRYAYNEAGELVGTSDARGCGLNFMYDGVGRLVGEDYSPCEAGHAPYSPPSLSGPTPSGLEVYYHYDSEPPAALTGAAVDHGRYHLLYAPADAGVFLRGKLTGVFDRAKATLINYDGRGRAYETWVRLARPGAPADGLAERYGGRWYHKHTRFDAADRVKVSTTGAQSNELLVAGQSKVELHYSARGAVKQVTSSYGALVTEVQRAADGLHERITYGDLAATTADFNYDPRRRLSTVQTYRGPPALWTTPGGPYTPPTGAESTLQLVLQNDHFQYDVVGNPTQIADLRNPDEWPAGAKPVTRRLAYDDLYRLTKADIGYTAADGQEPEQNDAWTDPHTGAPDPSRAKPHPRQSFTDRVRQQTYSYDWLGNLRESGDDASGFYDRSLGTAEHGAATGRVYQLSGADNRATGSPRQGALRASYDVTGNLTELRVDRDGPCIPAGECAQIYRYGWDEVGRLVEARRWDAASVDVESTAPPPGAAAVALHYAYDANDQRVLKRAMDPSGEASVTLYIFDSLELRRTTYVEAEEDYALNAATEAIYLLAGSARLGRVVYESSVPSSGGESLHVFLELGDHLGSTGTVLDLATSELVEKSTYYAYGGVESDYRPERWGHFREDYKFTGKEEDIEVGLVYFGKRFYAPALQRWVSPDPLVVHGLEADPNLYAYVSGQVLKSVDPLGLDLWEYSWGVGAGLVKQAVDAAAQVKANFTSDGERRGAMGAGAAAADIAYDATVGRIVADAHAMVETAREVASFGDQFAEAALGDYPSWSARGEAASKPVATAMKFTAAVVGLRGVGKVTSKAPSPPKPKVRAKPSPPKPEPPTAGAKAGAKAPASSGGEQRNNLGGLAGKGEQAAGRVAAPKAGQKVYRVYGGDAKPAGASWTPEIPTDNYRGTAGLPSGGPSGANNSGRFVIEGTLQDPSAVVKTRRALPLDGNQGGAVEYIIPNPIESGAVRVDRVSGVNPEF